MKNKNGFTLVELLAVISILTILVIIALPNVIGMFNDAKGKSFATECKQIYKVAQQQYVNDSLFETQERTYAKCETQNCGTELDLSGRSNIQYFIKFNKAGKVTEFYVTDGDYQYTYEGSDLLPTDIIDVEAIADIPEEDVIRLSCNGVSKEVIPSVGPESFLMAGTSGETNAVFLRTNIIKSKIEKIIIATSLNGHTPNGTNCWDVSAGENGSVLAWATDTDANGKYEVTIGTNGKLYLSTGQFLFYRLSNLKTIEGIENMDTSQVESMYHFFLGCWNLESVDLSHFNTSKVTNMNGMFGQCYKLTSIDVSHLDTSKVTNMVSMFENCTALTSIDISTFDTSSNPFIGGMFKSCTNLKNINFGNIDFSKVTSLNSLFESCTSLETVDLSVFRNAKPTNLSNMFKNCSSLKNVNLDMLNTSETTDIGEMFYGCSSLETLDLSSFDTHKVTRMYQMMQNCSNLRTIYASDNFVVSALSSVGADQNMFYHDTSLVGGSGTVYSDSYRGKAYAHIDGGVTNPGYFTRK